MPITVQGNSGETQGKLKKLFLKLIKVQGNSGETQGKLKKSFLTLQEAGGADSARPEEKLRFGYILVIQLTRKNLTFPK